MCTTRSKLFCFVCVTAVQQNLLTFSKNIVTSSTFGGLAIEEKQGNALLSIKSLGHSEAILKVN